MNMSPWIKSVSQELDIFALRETMELGLGGTDFFSPFGLDLNAVVHRSTEAETLSATLSNYSPQRHLCYPLC
jgi:hypothetical protein